MIHAVWTHDDDDGRRELAIDGERERMEKQGEELESTGMSPIEWIDSG